MYQLWRLNFLRKAFQVIFEVLSTSVHVLHMTNRYKIVIHRHCGNQLKGMVENLKEESASVQVWTSLV